MTRLALVLLAVLALSGCYEATAGPFLPPPDRATVALVTSTGVTVEVPAQLAAHYPAIVDAVLRKVTDTAPDADGRIPPGTRGTPAGFRVVVFQAGAYPSSTSSSGFAMGSTDLRATVWLALKRCSGAGDTNYLPALSHELRHVYTGDPYAGHAPGMQEGQP